jgi:hypothetical protein
VSPPRRSRKRGGSEGPCGRCCRAKKAAREEEARKKAADAASKTPPNEKVGESSDKLGGSLKNIDVMKLSQIDFSKLDEVTLAQLRGDIPE